MSRRWLRHLTTVIRQAEHAHELHEK